MLALIPIAALAGLAVVIGTGRPAWDWRTVILRATMAWAAWAVAWVEALSLFGAITPVGLALGWAGVVLLEAAAIVWLARRGNRPRWPRIRLPREWLGRVIAGAMLVILVVTGVVAWFAPPSTWDSLNYHMPRVAQWAQQRSLRPFPTGIEVQNSRAPGAEMLILHLYVLGRGDRLANFVGWVAFAASVLAAGLIAQQLGGGSRTQLAAGLLSAATPMAIVQASSTMTDGVVGLWAMAAAAECLAYRARDESAPWWAALAAALGLLTKPTAGAYLIPFGVWIGVLAVRRGGWRKALAFCGGAIALVAALNAGPLLRNESIYGTPLDPGQVAVHSNGLRNARGLISNLTRNLAVQIGTPSPYVNRGIYLAVAQIHEWMGLDLNDPRTTSAGAFAVRSPLTHEDLTMNPLHSLVYLCAFGLILARRETRRSPLLGYALSSAATLIILSFLFKWQIFGSRYLLPFFVLFAPAAARALDWIGRPGLAAGIGLALAAASWPWLTGIRSRPLIERPGDSYVRSILVEPRTTLEFANGRYLQDPYSEIAAEISAEGCGRVGLMLGGNAAEYPLWVLLGAPRDDLRLEWIVAGTASARFEDPTFEPCAVICDESCPADWQRVRGLPLRYAQSGFRLFAGAAP